MAFNIDDVTREIQRAVGLQVMNCPVPRLGNRTREGARGFDINSSRVHMNPMPVGRALLAYNAIPQATKDNPGNPDLADAIAMLARNAGQQIPPGCQQLLPNGQPTIEELACIVTPGSPIILGRGASSRYIMFLYQNTDTGYRIKYYNMTGREQYEWHDAWVRCGRTHIRVEAETRGLRGTDLNVITTAAQLQAALVRSPSLADRRPANHNIADPQWNNVRRNLDL